MMGIGWKDDLPRGVQCVTKSVLDLKMKVLPAELTVHRGSNLDGWKRQRLRSKLRGKKPHLAVKRTGRP